MPTVTGRAALAQHSQAESFPNPLPVPEVPKLGVSLRTYKKLDLAFADYDEQNEQQQKKAHNRLRDVLGRLIHNSESVASGRVLARKKYAVTPAGLIVEPALEEEGYPFSVTTVQVPLTATASKLEPQFQIEVDREGALSNAIPRVTMRLVWPGRNTQPFQTIVPLQGRTVGGAGLPATRVWNAWVRDQVIHEENLAKEVDEQGRPVDGSEFGTEVLIPDLLLVEFV